MPDKTSEIIVTDSALPVEVTTASIQQMIYTFRGQQVMLDSDLAMLYEVETKRLNESVKRNIKRFPESFCFQLTSEEMADLRSQIATSNKSAGGRRYAPYAFTEQGIAMLSAVLHSEKAIEVSIRISFSDRKQCKAIAGIDSCLPHKKVSPAEVTMISAGPF